MTRVLISLPVMLAFCAAYVQAAPDRAQVLQYAVESGERTWQRAMELSSDLSSRELFSYALVLCEAELHLDRIERLFEVATRMQDRDPGSRGYGNFRWRWSEGAVLDFNAVEFCMQSGTVIWLRHRDRLPPPARETLAEILDYAVEGCLRHRVPASYTNIALMNAQNLILLGEALDRSEVADEGYGRLERVTLYTWRYGTHEYCSPTYYGTNLDCLVLIEAFCQRESGREQARALLELLWTDIAANWFEPAGKPGGTCSRDYNYLRGLGYLQTQLWVNGWIEDGPHGGTSAIYPLLARWHPPDHLRHLSRTHVPRLVRQSWGIAASESRTHLVLPDVSLSSSGANYGSMDLPLTVDLPGEPDAVRCYFIPDARRDPYGTKRIPAGPHQKTLHLRPFFTAAQRDRDALALVIYRDRDIADDPATLESHFVMRRDVDGFWVGDERVDLATQAPFARVLQSGQALFLREGTAAVGIRVVWARGLDGAPASAAFVHDGNDHGAVRLTVAHHSFWGVERPQTNAAAALWLRVGSGLDTDEAFQRWRREFEIAEADVQVDETHIVIGAQGGGGPLQVGSTRPWAGASVLVPEPSRGVLEVDGEDIGMALLAGLAPVLSHQDDVAQIVSIVVPSDRAVSWEAEAGYVVAPMVVDHCNDASGAAYVWMPGEPGGRGGDPSGSVTWRLQMQQEGTYYVWGRVRAPTQEDDSFFVRVATDLAELVTRSDWHTGIHEEWDWTPVRLDRDLHPTPLYLPAGEVELQLMVREDGTAIDCLYITADPEDRPV